jgi:hypothetical protein
MNVTVIVTANNPPVVIVFIKEYSIEYSNKNPAGFYYLILPDTPPVIPHTN